MEYMSGRPVYGATSIPIGSGASYAYYYPACYETPGYQETYPFDDTRSAAYIEILSGDKKISYISVNAWGEEVYYDYGTQLDPGVNGTYVLSSNKKSCANDSGLYGVCSSVTVTIAGW